VKILNTVTAFECVYVGRALRSSTGSKAIN